MRALQAFIVVLVLTVTSTVSAQSWTEYEPESFGLEGTWLLTRIGHLESPSQDYPTDDLHYNVGAIGYDTLQLRAVAVEAVQVGLKPGLVYRYKGTWKYRRSLIDREYLGTPGEFRAVPCGARDYELPVTAELTYVFGDVEGGLGDGRFRLELDAEPPENEPYIDISQWRRSHVFADPAGDTLALSYPATTLKQLINHPSGCGWASEDFHLYQGAYHIFQRLGPDSPLPKAEIGGTVYDSLPDGTRTTDPVEKGLVCLERQRAHIRERQPGESDAEYYEFVSTFPTVSGPTNCVEIEGDGAFRFDEIPLLERTDSGGYQRVFYRLSVRDASMDYEGSEGRPQVVYYQNEFVPNLSGLFDVDRQIWLTPLDAIGTKKELVRRLSEMSVAFETPEEKVDEYLDTLLDDSGSITDAQLEGVERSILAERVVFFAAHHSWGLIQAMFKGLAEFVSSMVDGKLSTGNKAQAEKWQLYNDALETRTYELVKGADRSVVQRQLEALKDDLPLFNKRAAEMIKRTMRVALFEPITRLVGDPTTVEFVTHLRKGLEMTVDMLLASELQVGRDHVMKKIIELVAYPAWEVYALIISKHLDFSETMMKAWGDRTADRALFRQDRVEVYDAIQTLNEHAAWGVWLSESAMGLASAFEDAETVFGWFKFLPYVRAAETVSKGGKIGMQATSVLAPAGILVVEFPVLMYLGVDAAYRTTRSQQRLVMEAPTSPWDDALADAAVRRAGDYAMHLDELAGHLEQEAYAEALASFTDPESGGLRATALGFEDDVDRFLSVVSAARTDDEAFTGQLGGLPTTYGPLMDGTTEILDVGTTFFLRALAHDSATASAELDADRLRLLSAIRRQRVALDNFVSGPLETLSTGAAGMQVPNVVRIEELTVTSQSTGASGFSGGEETFDVVATVTNYGGTTVDGLGARLGAVDPWERVELPAQTDRQIGALAAGATTTVQWTATVDSVRPDGLVFSVELTENDATPAMFVGDERTVSLRITPEALDADLDALHDDWEATYGIDTGSADDAELDPDGDGLSNLAEQIRGTDPTVADTDGDGLSDDDERASDPTVADSDGDGVDDGEDGAPLDPTTTGARVIDFEEPVLSVPTTIRLTSDAPSAVIPVTNDGGGTLHWRAASANPAVVTLTGGNVGQGPIVLSTPLTPEQLAETRLETVVAVADRYGRVPDRTLIEVVVGDLEASPDDPTNPDGPIEGEDPVGDEEDPDGDSPGAEAESEDGGCGCSSSPVADASWPALLLVALIGRLRRRGG